VIPAPVIAPEPVKPVVNVPTILRQNGPEPQPQFYPDLADVLELEDNSNPTSPELQTLPQQPITQPQLPQQDPIPQPQQVLVGIQKVIDNAVLRGKILDFGA